MPVLSRNLPPVAAHLDAALEETPKPGDPRLAKGEVRLIATPGAALAAAAAYARSAGIEPIILGDSLEGEARELGALHGAMARGRLDDAPLVILSGGETTVTMIANGLAHGLQRGSLYELSIDIDGIFENVQTGEGRTIPRLRITNTVRLPSSIPFFCIQLNMWLEQGITSFPKLLIGTALCEVNMNLLPAWLVRSKLLNFGNQLPITMVLRHTPNCDVHHILMRQVLIN